MSSDYVRVTFIGLRAPGDIETLPPTWEIDALQDEREAREE